MDFGGPCGVGHGLISRDMTRLGMYLRHEDLVNGLIILADKLCNTNTSTIIKDGAKFDIQMGDHVKTISRAKNSKPLLQRACPFQLSKPMLQSGLANMTSPIHPSNLVGGIRLG